MCNVKVYRKIFFCTQAFRKKLFPSHSQHPQSVMVWDGISASGNTPLAFVDPGVKINKNYYLTGIVQGFWSLGLGPILAIGIGFFNRILLQPTRHEMFRTGVKPISPGLYLPRMAPYSPNLNPLDFSVWAILKARACAMPHKNLNSLRRSLLREWAKISIQEGGPSLKTF